MVALLPVLLLDVSLRDSVVSSTKLLWAIRPPMQESLRTKRKLSNFGSLYFGSRAIPRLAQFHLPGAPKPYRRIPSYDPSVCARFPGQYSVRESRVMREAPLVRHPPALVSVGSFAAPEGGVRHIFLD